MKLVKTIYLLVVAATLTSCEKFVTDVDVPEVKQQLVLFSFVSPEDTAIKAEVWMSKPVFSRNNNKTDEPVKDVTVTITSPSGQSAILPFNESVQAYYLHQSVFKIEAGKTYKITAVKGDFSLSATTTVPTHAAEVSGYTYQNLGGQNTSGNLPYYRHHIKWVDLADAKNYYRLSLSKFYVYNNDTGYNHIDDVVVNDESRNQQQLSALFDDYTHTFEFDSANKKVMAFLLTTDEAYYQYHLRRLNYYGEDPFSEPYPQYNNVNGGLGVFASYRNTQKSYSFK